MLRPLRLVQVLGAVLVMTATAAGTWVAASRAARQAALDECHEEWRRTMAAEPLRPNAGGGLYILSSPDGGIRTLCSIEGNRLRCQE